MPAHAPFSRLSALCLVALLTGCAGAPVSPSAVDTLQPSHARPSAQPPPSVGAIATLAPSSPSVSVRPGEPWIVYQGGTGGPARIRLVRPDGSGDHALIDDLTSDDPNGEQQHPDWSHDGTRIAFGADDRDGTQDLWIVNADGGGARKLFDCAAPCGWADHPAWSPDDRSIAFMSAEHVGATDSTSFLEVIDVASGRRRTVLAAPKLAWFYVPRWAPDGRRIVVEADRFATARFDEQTVTASTIGIVDISAAKPTFRPLLPWSSFATYPDWHPSADRIVLELPTRIDAPFDAADIALLDLHGGADPVTITSFGPGGGWAIQPSWNPDGSTISFVAEDVIRTHPNVAIIKPDGGGLKRLTDSFFRTHPRLRPTSGNGV